VNACRTVVVIAALLVLAVPLAAQVTAPDTAFMSMQHRGRAVMGVDQDASHHQFTPLPDGGRITLQQDHPDAAGVAAIRTHMATIAQEFRAGHFDLPAFIHAQVVPGTSVMAARRRRITYTVDTVPGGGSVRLATGDPAARDAIHEFLAFQAGAHHGAMSHAGMAHDTNVHDGH
jgi:hypothetical protein